MLYAFKFFRKAGDFSVWSTERYFLTLLRTRRSTGRHLLASLKSVFVDVKLQIKVEVNWLLLDSSFSMKLVIGVRI